MATKRTVVVVGMRQEAAIVAATHPGAAVVIGAGDAALLTARLESAIAAGADQVISVGICGALTSWMQVGDVVVGTLFDNAGRAITCDPHWAMLLYAALSRPKYARFAWSPTAVPRLTDKDALRAMTDADVVDEESYIAAGIAFDHKLPFAAMRGVSDSSTFTLPPAALGKLTSAGSENMAAILASIAGDPWQIPALIELAACSATAFRSLKAALLRVGDDFGWGTA